MTPEEKALEIAQRFALDHVYMADTGRGIIDEFDLAEHLAPMIAAAIRETEEKHVKAKAVLLFLKKHWFGDCACDTLDGLIVEGMEPEGTGRCIRCRVLEAIDAMKEPE